MLANTLTSWKFDASNLLIGLFDNDEEGLKAFDLGKNFEIYKDNIKRHKNGNAFAMVLPVIESLKDFANVKNLCIEFYFDYESLNERVDGMGLELEAQPIVQKWGNIETKREMPDIKKQLFLFKPKSNTKAFFAEKVVPTLTDDKFHNFKILFEQILEIINIHNEQNKLLDECAISQEDVECSEDN